MIFRAKVKQQTHLPRSAVRLHSLMNTSHIHQSHGSMISTCLRPFVFLSPLLHRNSNPTLHPEVWVPLAADSHFAQVKRYYLDPIRMQFPEGNDYPAHTSPVDSGCRLQRVPWRRPIRSAITSQRRAVISRLSVRCRTSGTERCLGLSEGSRLCVGGELRCMRVCVFFSTFIKVRRRMRTDGYTLQQLACR